MYVLWNKICFSKMVLFCSSSILLHVIFSLYVVFVWAILKISKSLNMLSRQNEVFFSLSLISSLQRYVGKLPFYFKCMVVGIL